MKKFVSIAFVLSFVFMSQACNVNKGLPAGISPAQALSGIQSLLGGSMDSALKGFAGDILTNSVMKKVMPEGLSAVTSMLGNSSKGKEALGLINGALGSVVPGVASSVLGNATSNIKASDAAGILKGGSTGATDFLKNAAGDQLKAALLPALTDKLKADGVMSMVTSALGNQGYGLLGAGKPSLPELLTSGAADGVFGMMGAAEEAERANPTDPALKALFSK